MSDKPEFDISVSGDARTLKALEKGRNGLRWAGVALIVIGAIAIVFPAASTLAVQLFIGWLFILAGVLFLVGAVAFHGTEPFFGSLLVGLLTFAVGAFLVFNPAGGAVIITLLIAALFMVNGAFELYFASALRPDGGRGWMLASGIVAIAVGILIAVGLPGTSMFILGLLVGLNFLTTGIAFVLIARHLEKNVRVDVLR